MASCFYRDGMAAVRARELPKIQQSISMQRPVSLYGDLENDPFRHS